jgi:hypothetical protein
VAATLAAGPVVRISTAACPDAIVYIDVNSNMCAEPLPCIDSTSTRPLNFDLSCGIRTTMRVLYGWPLAVPETKYSFAW